MCETAAERLFVASGDGVQERKRYILADDRCRLEKTLVVWSETVDASGEKGLDGRRNVHTRKGLDEAVRPVLAGKHPGLDERPRAFLEEEWVAFCPVDQKSLEPIERRISSEKNIQ
jgi:hypothetical protein